MKAISKINNTLAKIEGAVMVFWFAIVLGNVVVMIVFIRLLPIAMKFIGKNSKFLTSMMRIPFKYLYYSLPVGCVLTVVHLILKSILLFAPDTIEKA